MAVKPIPDGYHSVTPALIVDGAARLMEFLSRAFGAKERLRMPMPDGRIAHAELEIGDSAIMVADGSTEFPPGQSFIHLYVEDVDAVYSRASGAGAETLRAPEDQFYGDRSAIIRDPFGNRWTISTHVEDVPEDEMTRRAAAAAQG